MPGELLDRQNVGLDGPGRQVAQAHVLNESLPKRAHGASPRGERFGRPFTVREDTIIKKCLCDDPRHAPPLGSVDHHANNQPTPTTAERFSSTFFSTAPNELIQLVRDL
jgi:hypothetical protein